jgi:hypothetical protein
MPSKYNNIVSFGDMIQFLALVPIGKGEDLFLYLTNLKHEQPLGAILFN